MDYTLDVLAYLYTRDFCFTEVKGGHYVFTQPEACLVDAEPDHLPPCVGNVVLAEALAC